MTVRHHLIIIKQIAENYKIKELVLESMKKKQSINSFCVANLILLLSSVQYNQTFNTTPAGNSRQFTHARGNPVSIVPVSAITAGFTYFSTPFPRETRGYPRVWPHTHARAKLHCHNCGYDCPRLTVDGLAGTSREYKAPNLIFIRISTIIVRRQNECQRILYGLEADLSRFHHDILRYTTI